MPDPGYARFGHGPELLIALHGFGERAQRFTALEPALHPRYTLIAFDLPLHGRHEWPADSFRKTDILDTLQHILHQEGKIRFSLLAYSFGARLVLALLPEIADKLDRLILLAPEGFGAPGMRLAEWTPMAVRKTLYHRLKKSDRLRKAIQAGCWIGPKTVRRFLSYHLAKPERLRRAFGCWLSLPDFKIDQAALKKCLLQTNIPVTIYLGAHDHRIPIKPVQRWAKNLPNAQLIILNAGHDLFSRRIRRIR